MGKRNEDKEQKQGTLKEALKDRFFCRKNYYCIEACSKCCDYGECFSCASLGFPDQCQKCERNYTKEQLEKIRSEEAAGYGE